jgi:ATP-dependent exoDNAse (exonuclease V) beta subunit
MEQRRQVRVMESRDVAGTAAAAVEQKWEVVDKRTDAVRNASYRDIAILIPARTSLTSLERSLAEAGVPYRVEGGSLIYRTQEVRDLINCLTAIDDPADEVAIVGALRSPAFASSDVDIARFVAAGGRINYLRGDPGSLDGPVAQALLTLRGYHERRHGQSLAALVEEFVVESGLVETGILDQGDRNSFRRMRYVVEQARAFEAKGPESLRALVQWLEGCSQQSMLDHEGAGLDDDEDAVRVLTIHGAKGLEFPIVILAGMGSAPYSRPGNYLVDRSDETIAVQVGTKRNNRRFLLGDVDHLEQLEKDHCEAEFVRMLYVGATRARDHLVVSLCRTHRASKAAAVQLEAAGAKETATVLAPTAPVGRGAHPPFEGVQVDEPAAGTADDLYEQRRALVASSGSRPTPARRAGRFAEDKDAVKTTRSRGPGPGRDAAGTRRPCGGAEPRSGP